jgi:hypothetical protein
MLCPAIDYDSYTSTQHRSRPMTAVAERLNKSTAATWLRTDCDEWLNAQLIETARGGVRA